MESLLRCPLCAQPLDRQDTRYLCPRGHSFDRAAAQYVHLLPANKLHSKDPGDDKAMAAARNRFLSGGYYDPLRDALTRLAFTASSSECICISLLSLCRKKQAYDLPPNIISKATLYPKGREASSTYSSLV